MDMILLYVICYLKLLFLAFVEFISSIDRCKVWLIFLVEYQYS